MDKATQMAQVSARGGFHLLWGLVLSTVISAVGTIFIARLLGADNYGLYAIALTAPNLIANFRDWGITTAMIKYTAQHNSQNDTTKIRSIFLAGLTFETLFGLLLFLLSLGLSGFLAVTFNRPAIAPLIQIASFTILAGALVNTSTAAFTGMEKMHLNSIMLTIQSIIKTGLIIGLVLLGLGTAGAVIGFSIAVLFAGLTGILLMFTVYKSLAKKPDGEIDILNTTKTMLRYGLPLSIGTILTGFLTQLYGYFMAIYVTNNAIIGNYNVALNFVVLITFFATPVTTMLFPAFSKLDAQKDSELLKSVFQFSVKYAALVVVPVTVMIIVLAQPAIGTIFQDKYVQAPLFLALLSISYLYSAIGNLSVSNLINGQGYTTFNLKLCTLNAVIGFPVSLVLISQFGVLGLIVTSLTVGLPSFFISLRFIKKHFGVSVDWGSSAKILLSSAITGILTYVLISPLTFSNPIQLAIGVLVFVLIFLITAVLTRTIRRTDLNNMRGIIVGLGPLSKPLNGLVNLIDWLIRTTQS
jgi:O-antigen/teichoic acid export membrane protein